VISSLPPLQEHPFVIALTFVLSISGCINVGAIIRRFQVCISIYQYFGIALNFMDSTVWCIIENLCSMRLLGSAIVKQFSSLLLVLM